ncbi:hypothetical protein [Algicola sagamiensis]|uniref:hypothetical protein n=1 Tax=Algicola sagamiensis TaxID=163869 RepID=UPI000379900B|nr:hypothetical protein [Algicola sagamiensis]
MLSPMHAQLNKSGKKPTEAGAHGDWKQQFAGKNTKIPNGLGGHIIGTEADLAATYVTPVNYNSGTSTTNAVRPLGQAMSKVCGYRHVAGHMVNNHLGGSGSKMENITTFSHQDNMDHKMIEAPAKNAVSASGHNIVYWTAVTKRADFDVGVHKVENMASEIVAGFYDESTATLTSAAISVGPAGNTGAWVTKPTNVKMKTTPMTGTVWATGKVGRKPATPPAETFLGAADNGVNITIDDWETALNTLGANGWDDFLDDLNTAYRNSFNQPMLGAQKSDFMTLVNAEVDLIANVATGATPYGTWFNQLIFDLGF